MSTPWGHQKPPHLGWTIDPVSRRSLSLCLINSIPQTIRDSPPSSPTLTQHPSAVVGPVLDPGPGLAQLLLDGTTENCTVSTAIGILLRVFE